MVVDLVQRTRDSVWKQTYGQTEIEGSLPHYGKLIRNYRKRLDYSVEYVAEVLEVKSRAIYTIEECSDMPKDVKRRIVLANLLKIPPALLAIPGAISLQNHPIDENGAKQVVSSTLDPEIASMYEDNLKLAWNSYYTHTAQAVADTLQGRINNLTNRVEQSSGVARDQLLAMKCRFLQLDTVSARDRLDLDHAEQSGGEAIEIAEYLGNSDLLASALFRRARVYLLRDKNAQAVEDLERALPEANRSQDPLRSYVKICLAEAYSLTTPDDLATQQKVRLLLDEVGVALKRTPVMEGDGSYTRVDVAGWAMSRAETLSNLGTYALEDARDALEDARDALGPQWTRWQGNLEIIDAHLSLLERDPNSSSTHLEYALPIVIGTKSNTNMKKLVDVYKRLEKSYPKNMRVLKVKEALLSHGVTL